MGKSDRTEQKTRPDQTRPASERVEDGERQETETVREFGGESEKDGMGEGEERRGDTNSTAIRVFHSGVELSTTSIHPSIHQSSINHPSYHPLSSQLIPLLFVLSFSQLLAPLWQYPSIHRRSSLSLGP